MILGILMPVGLAGCDNSDCEGDACLETGEVSGVSGDGTQTGESNGEAREGLEGDEDAAQASDETPSPETEVVDEKPAKECPAPTGDRPAAIAEMVGTFIDGYLYFFGGDNGFPIQCNSNPNPQGELWRFDVECGQWEKIHGDDEGPGPRTRATGVLDTQNNRLLVFGGRYREGKEGDYTIYNDVWALDMDTYDWTKLTTSGDVPSARWSSTGIYDPIRHRLVIFSGNDGVSGAIYYPVGDAFALDLKTNVWTQIGEDSPSTPPDRLFGASMYDSGRDAMILFGGTTAFFGPQLNDVWGLNLDTDTWELYNMGVGKAPEKRFWSSITHDVEGDRYVVFGGHDDGALANRNDVWVYTPGVDAWGRASGGDLLNPAAPAPAWCDFPVDFVIMEENTPERRHMHLTVLGDNRDLYVIGGKTDCGIVDDVWRLNMVNLSWELLFEPTVGVSCERYGIEGCESFCF